MNLRSKRTRRLVLIAVVAGLIVAAVLGLALAQSGQMSFSLNSPVSFPVDI